MRERLSSEFVIGLLYTILIGLITIFMLYVPAIWIASSFLITVIIFVSRFLAGFGLLGLIFTAILYILKYIPKDYRKKKTTLVLVRFILCLSLIASIILPLWGLIPIAIGDAHISLPSVLYGLTSFVITMYLVPLWRERKLPEEERGFIESIRATFGRFLRKVKKGYYYYFSKDYIKAFSVDFIYLKTQIDSKRTRLGKLFFPLVIAATAYCPPALAIGLVYIARLRRELIRIVDNVALSIMLLVSLVAPMIVLSVTGYVLIWNLAYFLGSALAAMTFGPTVIDLIRG
ncbi:MAG: hypothetical protein QXH55_04075 [Candidatus Korarchaeota archaeon]|nr:DUF1616 domain-containing protein [Thermoproteota archaeon]MCR8463089.1 DUF1616 domain-containing protein [Thermoproteota archaeon]MCR8470753.1 DUF1616 domain-containing protein [Thermoproteota archaeon]MCR8471953.1 DUF1616 domain-containing protein [Thermoproteota archaeon]MCR8473264.1 DUF1616 domain-containing protein [Thermoproteota archaeon]